MNNIWDARDPYGHIRVVLSEQLVSKTPSPSNLNLGPINELVCFSFQHAPKGVFQITDLCCTMLIQDRYSPAGWDLLADTESSLPS